MTRSRVHVGRLTTLEEGPDGLRFTLDDGSVLTAEGVAPAFAFWSRLLTVSRGYGWPLYARCDPDSGTVRVLLPANAYTVAEVRPDPEGGGRSVAFVESHALHRLRGSRPDHEGMARRLEEAQRTGCRVLVTESPRDPEILDVRFDARDAAPTV
jgi:hypothetical protein